MSPEAQREAIALACGFTWRIAVGYNMRSFLAAEGTFLSKNYRASTDDEPISVRYLDKVPNYPNDLNGMHEAEKFLDDAQIDEYKHRLQIVVTATERISQCATASQRAEAFLRTLNLWNPTS